MHTKHIPSLDELQNVARDVLALCTPGSEAGIITLSGDLGAGKTAFVKEIAEHLGVVSEVTSPTFVVMKSYPIPAHPHFNTLTHMDAYRVESDDEMRVLGFAELCADASRLICIEWPERIAALIPEHVLTLTITIESDGSRTITYGKKD